MLSPSPNKLIRCAKHVQVNLEELEVNPSEVYSNNVSLYDTEPENYTLNIMKRAHIRHLNYIITTNIYYIIVMVLILNFL